MTIVLLPGLHGTDELFPWLIDALKPESSVLVVQYPRNECLSYVALANLIGRNLPPNSVLVAESFAGPLAVLLASAYPERIKGIVFSGSFIRSPVVPFLKGLHRILRPLLALIACLPSALLEQIAFRFGGYQYLLKGRSNPELLAQLRLTARKLNPTVILFRIGQLLNTDVSAEFAKLGFPMVYLRGVEDKLVPIKNSQGMQQLNPRMVQRSFPCGHLVLQLHPKEAAEEIQAIGRLDR